MAWGARFEDFVDDIEEDAVLFWSSRIKDSPQWGETLLAIQQDLWDEVGMHLAAKLDRHLSHLALLDGVPEQDRARRESAVDRVEMLGDLGTFPDIAPLDLGNPDAPWGHLWDQVLEFEWVSYHVPSEIIIAP
jgi:hypothetical protein